MCGFAATTMMARHFGAASYGKLSYAYAVISILSPIGSLGIGKNVSVHLRDKQQMPALVKTGLGIERGGALLIALFATIIAASEGININSGLFLIASFANLANSTQAIEASLLDRKGGWFIGLANCAQATLGIVCVCGAIMLNFPLVIMGLVPLIKNLLRSILLEVRYSSIDKNTTREKFNASTAKTLMRRGVPLTISGISIMLYMKIDQIMIEAFNGFAALGIYSIAVLGSTSLYFVPQIVAQTLMRKFEKPIKAESPEKMNSNREEMLILFKAAWITGIIIFVLNCTILPRLIFITFGDQYQESMEILPWLSPAGFAVSIGCAFSVWQNINDKVNLMMLTPLLSAVINVGLNFLLIPSIGIKGAAISTTISYFLSIYLTGLFDKSLRSDLKIISFPFLCKI